MNLRVRYLVLASLLTGCGGAPPAPVVPPAPVPPTPATQPTPEPKAAELSRPVPEKHPFAASASAPTEGEAYERAARRLVVALLDDEDLLKPDPFSDQLARSIHRKDVDVFESRSEASGFEVKIGLTSEALGPTLARLEASLESVHYTRVAEPLAEAIRAVRLAQLGARLCQRRNELFQDAHCEPVDPAPVEARLRGMLQSIELVPLYEDGVPRDGEKFLRPLVVETRLGRGASAIALSHLPLQLKAEGPAEPLALESDPNGKVSYRIPPEASLDSTFAIRVDTEALLGPLASLWSPAEASFSGRVVGVQRSAFVVRKPSAAGETAAKAVQKNLQNVVTRPVSLSSQTDRRLARATPQSLRRVAPTLADEMQGELDTLFFVEAESEFASRMGTHRVWYEARGNLVAVSAWTGEVLHQVDAVVTESGVGEARAERAALESLGRELAGKMKAALRGE